MFLTSDIWWHIMYLIQVNILICLILKGLLQRVQTAVETFIYWDEEVRTYEQREVCEQQYFFIGYKKTDNQEGDENKESHQLREKYRY